MDDLTCLRVSVDGAVALIELDRPERLNALNPTLMNELITVAERLDDDPTIRAAVVTGRGRAFCAGFDLDVFAGSGLLDGSWADRYDAVQLGASMADTLEQIRPITVAALHGHVVGGGVVLAAACDLRVATDDTVFSIPEVDIGIPLAWGGIPRLVRELGPALTKELVMTCRPFSAAEAAAAGFLNRVVEAGGHLAAADELAAAVAARPAVPVTITKRHVNAVVRQASMADFAFTDGAALMAALADPEAAEWRRSYLTGHRSEDPES